MSDLAPGGGSLHEPHQSDSKIDEIFTADGQVQFRPCNEWDGFYDLLIALGWFEAVMRILKIKYRHAKEKPTAIQKKGLVPFLTVSDVIKQALAGKGPAETFCLRILEQLNYGLAECQALVLSPDHEVVLLIAEFIQETGEALGVKVCACFGGKIFSLHKDHPSLSSGVHVVVGTPGNVLNLLRRQSLCPDHMKMFAMEEADKLLSCGHKDQINDIFHLLPSKVQLCSYSATLHPKALEILSNFTKKPVRILVNELAAQEEGIKQFYVIVEKENWKLEILYHIYETLAMSQSVIFVKTPRNVDWLTDKMRCKGYSVSAKHRYMDRNERDKNMQDFQSGSSRVLITTPDLLVCATYLQKVSLVINFDLPKSGRLCNWFHGRFGREGVVIDLLTTYDEESLAADIQRFCNVVVVDQLSPDNVAETPL